MDCIICRRMLDKEEQFLVRWEGDFEPTWESGEILRNDCTEVVEEYLYTFVFAWYTCISATHVGFSSTKITKGYCMAKFTGVKLENCIRPTSAFMHSGSVEAHAEKVEVAPSGVSTLGCGVDGKIFPIC